MNPQQFDELTYALPEPMCLLSVKGQVLTLNPEAERLFGKPKNVICGKAFSTYINDPENKFTRYFNTCLRSRERLPGSLKLRITSDRILECGFDAAFIPAAIKQDQPGVLLRLSPKQNSNNRFKLLNDELKQTQHNFHKVLDEKDQLENYVSERTRELAQRTAELQQTNEELNVIQEDLQRHRDNLEKLVEERTAEVKRSMDLAIEAKKSAENANKAKSMFIANMSHELRTPLTSILGFAELALDPEESLADREEKIRIIMRSGQHLLDLINDLLDISKIEAGKFEIERAEMSIFKLMDEVNSYIGKQAEQKGLTWKIQYSYPMPRVIQCDQLRLKQVMLNLCGNAVKFTESGRVNVSVTCDINAELLEIEVVDSGIGMSEEQQKYVFNAFEQADASITRRFGGTGLGLYLSKSLLQYMGGSLTCRSSEGIGSRFLVKIPTGALNSVDIINADSECMPDVLINGNLQTSQLLTGEVLLAEDFLDNQRLISWYLSKLGVKVTLVENGKDAIELAAKRNFDLILMDMQMPEMDGVTAIKTLRQQNYKGPIIALTANAMAHDRATCLAAGCNDFIAKPIDTRQFNETVCRYIPTDNELMEKNSNPAPGEGTEHEIQLKSQPRFEQTDIGLVDADHDPDFELLVSEFITHLHTQVSELKRAASQDQWQNIASISHQLKGSGKSYGFPQVTNIAAKIEQQVRAHDYADAQQALKELNDYCLNLKATGT